MLRLEPLESRTVPTVIGNLQPSGILIVNGDGLAHSITLAAPHGSPAVWVGDETATIEGSFNTPITGIEVLSNGSGNRITLDPTLGNLPVWIVSGTKTHDEVVIGNTGFVSVDGKHDEVHVLLQSATDPIEVDPKVDLVRRPGDGLLSLHVPTVEIDVQTGVAIGSVGLEPTWVELASYKFRA